MKSWSFTLLDCLKGGKESRGEWGGVRWIEEWWVPKVFYQRVRGYQGLSFCLEASNHWSPKNIFLSQSWTGKADIKSSHGTKVVMEETKKGYRSFFGLLGDPDITPIKVLLPHTRADSMTDYAFFSCTFPLIMSFFLLHHKPNIVLKLKETR